MEQVVPACIGTLTSPHFRAKDANSLRVVSEVAGFILDLQMTLGPAFLNKLTEIILPGLQFPPAMVQVIRQSFEGAIGPAPIQKALRTCIAAPS